MSRSRRTTAGSGSRRPGSPKPGVIALALSIAALFVGLVALTRGGAQPSVVQGPVSTASLNEMANARIRADVKRGGMVVDRTLILSSKIDGNRGIVVAQVDYGKQNAKPHRAVLTLTFYRTQWTLDELLTGAPEGYAN